MKTIYIDAGHGGTDPGAVNGRFLEKDMNLFVAQNVALKLKKYDINIYLSRDVDEKVELKDRKNEINELNPDLALSIHHNSGGGKGYDIIHSIVGGKGEEFSKVLSKEFDAIGQVPHGTGVKYIESKKHKGKDRLFIIKYTKVPTVVSEFAFIDTEVGKVNSIDKLKVEADAIVSAIVKYFNLDESYDNYTDLDQVSEWAKDSVEYVIKNNIIVGNNKEFRPKDNITREEMAVILHRILKMEVD